LHVAFSHTVQLHLAAHGFPTPAIVGTRAENNSMLQHDGNVYELFRFVEGYDYAHSEPEAADAGATLARLHATLGELSTSLPIPNGSYHASPRVRETIDAAGRRLDARGRDAARRLSEVYESAGSRVGALAPPVLGHGDFHPGNLIYRDAHVAAVLDFDAARLAPPETDAAAAALHLSLRRGGGALDLDPTLFRAFWSVFERESGLGERARQAVPPLAVEAVVAEACEPVARTGQFGSMAGGAFLEGVAARIVAVETAARQSLTGLGD